MNLSGNIPKLYAFAFLKMALLPLAVITFFWLGVILLCLLTPLSILFLRHLPAKLPSA